MHAYLPCLRAFPNANASVGPECACVLQAVGAVALETIMIECRISCEVFSRKFGCGRRWLCVCGMVWYGVECVC